MLRDDTQLWKLFVENECGVSAKTMILSGSSSRTFPNLSPFYKEILDIARELMHDRQTYAP